MEKETHGQRLRRMREKQGMTQVQLQHAAKVDQSTLSGIEKHNAMPKWDTLIRLADALNTSPEYLMTGKTSVWPFRIDMARFTTLGGEDRAYVEGKLEAAIEAREIPEKTATYSGTQQHSSSSGAVTKKELGRLPGELTRTGQAKGKSGAVDRHGALSKKRSGGRA